MNRVKDETRDNAGVILPPPILWAGAVIIGLGLNYLTALRFVPDQIPRLWLGLLFFITGFGLILLAIRALKRAQTRVEPYKPTTAIVAEGPYRYTRNPIYMGMFLGLIGLATSLDNLWLLLLLAPFYLAIRYGVVAREETYLTRKFGQTYLGYQAKTRRWL